MRRHPYCRDTDASYKVIQQYNVTKVERQSTFDLIRENHPTQSNMILDHFLQIRTADPSTYPARIPHYSKNIRNSLIIIRSPPPHTKYQLRTLSLRRPTRAQRKSLKSMRFVASFLKTSKHVTRNPTELADYFPKGFRALFCIRCEIVSCAYGTVLLQY